MLHPVRTLLCLLILTLSVHATLVRANEIQEQGSFGLTNFAFASYLGTGFYTSSGQDVFVFQLPFYHDITEMTDTQDGWRLNLALTFGVVNFDDTDISNLPDVNDVTTLTFLPGIEYRHPVTPNWNIRPFFDYGFARDFNYSNNILVMGTGIRSYFDFWHDKRTGFTLGNHFIYAREDSGNTNNSTDYTLIQTGLNYVIKSRYHLAERQVHFNAYYVYFYYPDDLVLLERTATPIRVGNEFEIGITVSNLPSMFFVDKPQIGLGVRSGGGVTAYRLVFGMPF